MTTLANGGMSLPLELIHNQLLALEAAKYALSERRTPCVGDAWPARACHQRTRPISTLSGSRFARKRPGLSNNKHAGRASKKPPRTHALLERHVAMVTSSGGHMPVSAASKPR